MAWAKPGSANKNLLESTRFHSRPALLHPVLSHPITSQPISSGPSHPATSAPYHPSPSPTPFRPVPPLPTPLRLVPTHPSPVPSLTSPPNPSHPISFYSITSHTIQPHQLPSCPISLRPFPSRSIPHHLRLSPTCLSALTTMNNAAFQRVLQVKSTGCPPHLPVMFMSLNAVPFIPGHRSWCRYNQSV